MLQRAHENTQSFGGPGKSPNTLICGGLHYAQSWSSRHSSFTQQTACIRQTLCVWIWTWRTGPGKPIGGFIFGYSLSGKSIWAVHLLSQTPENQLNSAKNPSDKNWPFHDKNAAETNSLWANKFIIQSNPETNSNKTNNSIVGTFAVQMVGQAFSLVKTIRIRRKSVSRTFNRTNILSGP